jgi:hypothetical protein
MLVLVSITAKAQEAAVDIECRSPSPYAQELMSSIKRIIKRQDMNIRFCISEDVLYAKGQMVVTKTSPHPYISYEKIYVRDPFVYYNPVLLNYLDVSSGSKFASVALLTHELGNAVRLHVIEQGGTDKEYLKDKYLADYYTGFVMAKLKAGKSDFIVAQRMINIVWGAGDKQDVQERMNKAVVGWNDGGGNELGKEELTKLISSIMSAVPKW